MQNERNPIETILQNAYSMRELEQLFLINPKTVHTWLNTGTYTPWLSGNTPGGSKRLGKYLFSALDVFTIYAVDDIKRRINMQPSASIALQQLMTDRALDRLRVAWGFDGEQSLQRYCIALRADATDGRRKAAATKVASDDLTAWADSPYMRVLCPTDSIIDHVLEKLATIRESDELYEDCQHKATMRLFEAKHRLTKTKGGADKAAISKEVEVLSRALNH